MLVTRKIKQGKFSIDVAKTTDCKYIKSIKPNLFHQLPTYLLYQLINCLI